MEMKAKATAADIQKALGIKGTLKYAAKDNGEVHMTVAVASDAFLKALKLCGSLENIETSVGDKGEITDIVITSVGDVSAPAKRGRKPKILVQ